MRWLRSQRSSWESSKAFAIVIISRAPGAAATKYWNADERASRRTGGPPPSCLESHSWSARLGSIEIAHRFSASSTSTSRWTPSRWNARETRSCWATSQTIVRLPAAAAARPRAAETVVLPTPPLPVT